MAQDPTRNNSPQEGAQPVQTAGFGRRLLQSTSVVSFMTLLSRILGLVRDVVFARFFGATIVMDAFIVANRIANMLRRFFAEGAFSQGFVPVMARYREQHDHDEAREFVDAVAGTLGLLLGMSRYVAGFRGAAALLTLGTIGGGVLFAILFAALNTMLLAARERRHDL